jgi:hypothetical protein
MHGKSPGERLVERCLISRDLSFRYEAAESGPNPDFWIEDGLCGDAVLEVYEPVCALGAAEPSTPTKVCAARSRQTRVRREQSRN